MGQETPIVRKMSFQEFAQGGPRIEAGQEHDVTIEDTGDEGDGVARVQGRVVFVPDTDVGDEVTVEITRVGGKVAFAEVVGG